MSLWQRFKDAITGRFVKAEEAQRRPETTYKTTRKRKSTKR